MTVCRRDLLRLRLTDLENTGAGEAVEQEAQPRSQPQSQPPGCSAERGYGEAPAPWMRRDEQHD